MRLWSIHPQYLDTKGLVALWREALLAQAVLEGNTKGYRNHPQIIRFKESDNPLSAIATYLEAIYRESKLRHYNFDQQKINNRRTCKKINVTSGQIDFEKDHLLRKLKLRDPSKFKEFLTVKQIALHPSFKLIEGEVENWEILN